MKMQHIITEPQLSDVSSVPLFMDVSIYIYIYKYTLFSQYYVLIDVSK